MLRALHLTNWKSFGGYTDIPLNPLTFLVGPNGSGKSNVLDALRFFQGAALGYAAEDILRGTTEAHGRGWPGIRGGEAESARVGAGPLSLGISFEPPFPGGEVGRFLVGFDPQSTRTSESFAGFDTSMTLDGGSSPTDGRLAVRMSDFLLALRQSEHATPQAGVALTWLESMLRAFTHILELQPHRMREYAPGKAKTLGDSGENLSAVLRACSPSKLEDIQDWVEELCGPTVKGIRFDETQLGDVLFFLEENDGRRVSARSVSDGTLRFLGLVTVILTVPEGSVLVMEEPDTGLHPARLGLLAELLQDTAKHRKLQILATTHSSTLLAYLRPEVLGEAVALRRDPETGESRASPLAAIPYFETLRDSDRIAELLSTGWLEHAQ